MSTAAHQRSTAQSSTAQHSTASKLPFLFLTGAWLLFYSEHLFDKVDQDCDGLLDVADFKLLIKQIGLILNTREFYSVWLTLDKDRGGDVNFDEWFRWIKANTKDPVVKALQQSIRMTRMLGAAKGAMVYSVDQANSSGRKALAELFDCVDQDGSVETITDLF